MKFKNIEAFLAVAENSSFTKAAEQLNCSQSTITMQIKELEKEVGTLLFDRVNKNVNLTSAGKIFLPYAQKTIFDTNTIMSQLSDSAAIEGELNIAVWQTLNMFVMPDILDKYMQRYPKVKLFLSEPDPGDIFELLAKNKIDFAYLADDPVIQSNIVQFSGKQEELCFVVSKNHPLTEKNSLLLKDLCTYSFLVTLHDHCYHAHLLRELGRQNLKIQTKLESGNTEPLKLMAERGQGIAYLPYFSVRESLEDGRLVKLNVTDCKHSVFRQIIYHRNKWVTPAMKAMIELIKEAENSI